MRSTTRIRRSALHFSIAAACTLGTAPMAHSESFQATGLGLNRVGPPSSYVSVANKAGLEDLAAITLEGWVYPESYAGFPTIVGNNYQNSFWLGLNGSGQLRFYPNGGAYYETNTAVAIGQWTHVAATYEQSAGTVKLYLNGNLEATYGGVTGTTGSDPGDLRIGADREGSTADYFWIGFLDEVRIWDVARTSEIKNNLYMPCPVQDVKVGAFYSHLVASWGFNTFLSGLRSRPGTAVGTLEYSRSDRPQLWAGTALALQSASDYVIMGPALDYSAGVTLTAWVFPTASGASQTILGRDYETSFWFGIEPGMRLSFYPRGGVGSFVDGLRPLPLHQWSFVAAVYRDGRTRLYVNGELDIESTAISGAILDNGRAVYLGADNNATGAPNYPFLGQVGMAHVISGPKNLRQVRRAMYAQLVIFSNLDEDFIARDDQFFLSEPGDATFFSSTVMGPGAHFVQSGSSQVDNLSDPQPGGCHPGVTVPLYYSMRFTSKNVIEAPVVIEDSLQIAQSGPIASVDVYVNLQYDAGEVPDGEDDLKVELFDPLNTGSSGLTVFKSGRTPARDLITQFDDDAVATIETGRPPYLDCVRPRNELNANLAGRPMLGTWRLRVTSNGVPVKFCRLNSWGLRLGDVEVAAVTPAVREPGALAFSRAHPFGDRGGFRFALARESRVRLTLLDVTGRRVALLDDGFRPAGAHTIDWTTSSLPSGVYMAKLEVAGRSPDVLSVLVLH